MHCKCVKYLAGTINKSNTKNHNKENKVVQVQIYANPSESAWSIANIIQLGTTQLQYLLEIFPIIITEC